MANRQGDLGSDLFIRTVKCGYAAYKDWSGRAKGSSWEDSKMNHLFDLYFEHTVQQRIRQLGAPVSRPRDGNRFKIHYPRRQTNMHGYLKLCHEFIEHLERYLLL